MKTIKVTLSILLAAVPAPALASPAAMSSPRLEWRLIADRSFAGDVALGAGLSVQRALTRRGVFEASALARGAEILKASWEAGPGRGRTGPVAGASVEFRRYRYPFPDVTDFSGSDRIKSLGWALSLGYCLRGGIVVSAAAGTDAFYHDEPFHEGGAAVPPAPGGTSDFVSISASVDRLDREFYPSSGFALRAERREWGVLMDDAAISAAVYGLYGSAFLSLPASILSVDVSSRLSDGPLPLHLRSRLGGERTIRGRDFAMLSGDNSLLCRSELSIPLNFDDVSELGNPVILVDLSLFADAGAAWDEGEELSDDGLFGGFGACLDFIPHQDLLIKIGAAWNRYSNGTFYFDIGLEH